MHWYDNRFQGFVKYVEIDGTVKDRKRVNTFYGYFFYNEHLAGTMYYYIINMTYIYLVKYFLH